MTLISEFRHRSATLIFDLEDSYARDRGVRGQHPRPLGPVKFFLVGQMVGGVREEFETPLELLVTRNPSGYCLFFDTIRVSSGPIRRIALAAGTYVVRVESRSYQWAERDDIRIPESADPYLFDLVPGYAYPFPPESSLSQGRGPMLLRGSLQQPDGRGIARATIQVTGQSNTYWTDQTGQWVLVFPDTQPSGNVTVRFELPDGTIENVANVAIEQGRERSLGQTALRGWVMTDAGVGIPRATIQVSGHPAQMRTNSAGSWFYYFGLNQLAETVNVTATLADGRSLTQSNVQVQPRTTVTVDTFRFS